MPPVFANANNQYQKNKDLKREDVQNILEWMGSQPHLPKITELQAQLFLYSCYCSNEATKKCIDNYYTARTICTEFFSSRNPKVDKDLDRTLKNFIITPLPKLTPEGYCIFYNKMINTSPDVFVFNSAIKTFDMSTSLYLQEQGPLQGHIIVVDLTGATLTHLLKVGPLAVKKYLFFLQEALPVRLKAFHFTNAVSFMDRILAMMRPFMKKELMEMINIHQPNTFEIFKKIPKDCLPIEVGGTGESILTTQANNSKRILENIPFFVEEEKNEMVDETKRPGKPKNAGDLFGVEGTFKKLDID